ncbi:MAG: eL32 family ribosomal protein [Nanoarchaeota archaeon]|nr:eL32 family ribosomal protein [Nanoarchaeota archaeon]
MVDERLLKLRNERKKVKPAFIQQCAHKIITLSFNWRRSKGITSKMRMGLKSKRKSPGVGYSSPKKVKGLNKLGLQNVLVSNVKELENIDPKTQIVLISHVGLKRKTIIIKACQEKKLAIANVKNINEFITKVNENMDGRQKYRKELLAKRKKSQEIKKDKKKEEKKEEVKEETKKGEKSEKIKQLEKRQ